MENLDNSLEQTEESLILFDRAGQPVIRQGGMLTIMYTRDAKKLAEVIKVLPDNRIRLLLEWTIRIEWGEGTVILQHEIEARELNFGSIENRFEL